MKQSHLRSALVAELMLVGVLVAYGPFSVFRLVLLMLLASQSLWLRGSDWRTVGLRRPMSVGRTALIGVGAAIIILVVNRLVLLPLIESLGISSPDLSSLGEPGNSAALMGWLAQAWTLAAFAEEMVFRGYLINRVDTIGLLAIYFDQRWILLP